MGVNYFCCPSCGCVECEEWFRYCDVCGDYVCDNCVNSNGKDLEYDEVNKVFIIPEDYKCNNCDFIKEKEDLKNEILNSKISNKVKNSVKKLFELMSNPFY